MSKLSPVEPLPSRFAPNAPAAAPAAEPAAEPPAGPVTTPGEGKTRPEAPRVGVPPAPAALLGLPAGYRPRKPVPFKTRPSLDFSLIGLVYCSMMMFMGLAAINTQANLLFGVFGLMVGVLLISGVISRWVIRNVSVRRTLPEHAAVGSPVRITYDVENRKRWWPTLSVTIAELDARGAFDRQPHAYVMHAAAGMTATVIAEVVPVRRGLHHLERFQLSTSFPFGFIKRALIRRQPDTILVHPAQGAVDPGALDRFLSAESSGLNQRPREGGADEFYGTREYRSGDPLRMVHWRRSARTAGGARGPDQPYGTLIVKQMTRVSPPRLMLLVDTYAPAFSSEEAARAAPPADAVRRDGQRLSPGEARMAARAAGKARHERRLAGVERNLSVAASLLAVATKRGLSVGLIVWNGTRWVETRLERGKRHSRDLLAVLAGLGRNHQQPLEALSARGLRAATGDTTAVLITSGQEEPRGIARGSTTGLERRGPVRGPTPAARSSAAGPSRGALVRVLTDPELGELPRWVRFEPSLDFGATIDADEDEAAVRAAVRAAAAQGAPLEAAPAASAEASL